MIFSQDVPIIVFKVKQLKRSGDLEFRSDIGSFKKGKKKKKKKKQQWNIVKSSSISRK